MKEQFTKVIDTTDHRCVLNAGGVLLINLEELDAYEDPLDIAENDESILLSPDEALRIATFVGQHQRYLEERAKELARYFTEVATAWLDEFTQQAKDLCDQQIYWWPQIRREAHNTLLDLTRSGTNLIIAAWYKQCRQEDFPRLQQEALLTRYFKRLYYERYPVPVVEDEENQENDAQ